MSEPIATRAWVEPIDGVAHSRKRWPRWVRRRWRELLVVDVEAMNQGDGHVGPGYQRPLLVGWRHIVDGAVIEEGLAYPDDLPERDPPAYRRLRRYVGTHAPARARSASRPGEHRPAITLMPLSQFLDERVYRYCVRRGVALVGFNLAFDLAALAKDWRPVAARHTGAITLSLWGQRATNGRKAWDDGPGRPRVRVQHLDRHGALMSWTRTAPGYGNNKRHGQRRGGAFLDLHRLVHALTGDDRSLDAACATLGVPCRKVACTFGRLDARLIDHVRADVAATAALAARLLTLSAAWGTRHDGTPIVSDPSRLHSPNTLADALLDATGVKPLAQKLRDGALRRRDVMAAGMAALYAGRMEVRVLRQRVPVVPVDFGSMYPSVSILLGIARLWRAARIEAESATGLVRRLLRPHGLRERLGDAATWAELGVTLVEVEPGGEPWPRRTRDGSHDWRFSVGPLRYRGRLWFAWPDVAAAVLASGQPVRIVRAVRLVPRGTQRGLRPLRLASGTSFDLRRDDLSAALVAERQWWKDSDTPSLAGGVKIAANGLAHGIVSRQDRERYRRSTPLPMLVAGGPGEHAETAVANVERPGPQTFPSIAATVTAAGRLLMAMLERDLLNAGASVPWAYCDTDGAGIIATPDGGLVPCAGGPERLPDGAPAIRAVSFETLRRILDDFAPLNVLGDGSPWRGEHDAMREPVHVYALALKRYVLLRERDAGPEIAWASEHGIGGVLADPYRGERDPRSGVLRLAVEWWRSLLDPMAERPWWAALPAWEPHTAGTPRIAEAAGVRPFAFYFQARPPLLSTAPKGGVVLAPFEADPAHWPALPCSQAGEPVQPLHSATSRTSLYIKGVAGTRCHRTGGNGSAPAVGGPAEHVEPVVALGRLDDELTRYRLSAPPVGWDATGQLLDDPDDLDEGEEAEPDLTSPALLVATPVESDPSRRVLIGREAFDEPEHGSERLRTIAFTTCAGCGHPLAGRERTWCRSCHDDLNATTRRRILDAGRPRCAVDDCTEPVRRRGARCDTHRREHDRLRKRRERAAVTRGVPCRCGGTVGFGDVRPGWRADCCPSGRRRTPAGECPGCGAVLLGAAVCDPRCAACGASLLADAMEVVS